MIQKDRFTKEWIEQVKNNLNYPDVNLIEKVIRAFSLVEMLTLAGCPYIWKGGSSLMHFARFAVALRTSAGCTLAASWPAPGR